MRALRVAVTLALGLATSSGDAASGDDPLQAVCGAPYPALRDAATEVLRRKNDGAPSLLADELALFARDRGSENPSPRALVLTGADLDGEAATNRVRSWAAGQGASRACGLARSEGKVAIVVAPVLATLADVPRSVRPSAWVTVRATLKVPASDAKLIVLGPRGVPRSVPTSQKDGKVLARFRADREGRFVAQILADLDDGPRPVAEVVIVAGDPGASDDDPGPKDVDDAAKLLAFVREREGLGVLTRDKTLDKLAQAHAKSMAEKRRVAHDLGDGDPAERVSRELDVSLVGENVARGRDQATAHRLLWGSPSHRANLLGDRFTRVGVGTHTGADGLVYVAELFAR